jgi:hypothetical protein
VGAPIDALLSRASRVGVREPLPARQRHLGHCRLGVSLLPPQRLDPVQRLLAANPPQGEPGLAMAAGDDVPSSPETRKGQQYTLHSCTTGCRRQRIAPEPLTCGAITVRFRRLTARAT